MLGIRARLGVLVARDWFEESRHPAAPEAIFEALREALSGIPASEHGSRRLLDAFEPRVSAGLTPVYAAVNDRLKARQVLPNIRPRVVHTRDPHRARASGSGPSPRRNPG
jgi:hypothetical protein